jgi:hypothetical protein
MANDDEYQLDPRLVAARSTDGEHWLVVLSRVGQAEGPEIQWYPPQPVAFALLEAKRLCDRAVPLRHEIVGDLRQRINDTVGPRDPAEAVDVVSDLWSAVIHSFAAIEAMANDSIDRLPREATVTIGRKNDTREIAQPDMVWRLNLDEKLKLAVPMLDDEDLLFDGPRAVGKLITGTRPWECYLHLKRLRDGLVHVKREASEDPAVRTAFDRLLLGDADDCARDAFEIVQAARPGLLPPHVIERLTS